MRFTKERGEGDKMLKRFTVKGFKNFRDELVFDLTNVGKYSFNSDHIKNGIINKGIIYGKNGAGKSNLGEAIFDIESNLDPEKSFRNASVYKNMFDLNQNPYFKYEFVFGNDEVVYEYRKSDPLTVVWERLWIDGEAVLTMDNDKIECNIPAVKDLNFSSKTKNLSAVLFIYRTLSGKALKHIAALVEFAQNMLWFRGKSNPERIEDCIISENKVQDFESFLRAMGLDYHLSVKEVPGIFEQGKPRKIIFANFGKNEASLNSVLSTGTESLTLFYYWSLRFKSLSFLFIIIIARIPHLL